MPVPSGKWVGLFKLFSNGFFVQLQFDEFDLAVTTGTGAANGIEFKQLQALQNGVEQIGIDIQFLE